MPKYEIKIYPEALFDIQEAMEWLMINYLGWEIDFKDRL
jgi:hypothetical protein